MALRPLATQYFEIYTPRQDTVRALLLLADSGAVELDSRPALNFALQTRPLAALLKTFRDTIAPYWQYLPAVNARAGALVEAPEQTAAHALETIRQWGAGLDQAIERRRALAAERENLQLLDAYLGSAQHTADTLRFLAQPAALLHRGLYACPPSRQPVVPNAPVVETVHAGAQHRFVVLAGPAASASQIEQEAGAAHCKRVVIPPGLGQAPQRARERVAQSLRPIEADIGRLDETIAAASSDPAARRALADVALLEWVVAQAGAQGEDETRCRITGWTRYPDPGALEALLRAGGVHGIVRFVAAAEPEAPVALRDTVWTRPFRPLAALYGTPGRNEIDPALALAIIVPLLFGYMFPDIGHGLILLVCGAVGYRRWPAGRILIPCGMSAMLFGLVFGEVFGLDGLIDPLWVRPLDAPLEILLVPLLGDAALIALGMVFSIIEAQWRGEGLAALLSEGPLLVLYLSAIAAWFYPWCAFGALLAAIGFAFGVPIRRRIEPALAIAPAWGWLLENVYQLAMNTLSFVRVGAFALAHAAISSAIPLVAASAPGRPGFWALFVIGHGLAVALEALVVFVQTTRLVFFEFFTRFLRAQARPFRPLQPPPH
jgi:V/A-type H+-transporting ATPase subunit I